MYYQPEGLPYKKTTLIKFKPPRNRHYSMNVAYAEGGATLNDASNGLSGYIWKVYIKNNSVYVKREGENIEHKIFDKADITQIDLTFDQNMRPFICYVANNLPYYYHFNAEDSSYSEVALPPEIKFPRAAITHHESHNIPVSDIILAYTREGNLCYRIQRERYKKEYIIATDPKKSMLWRVGLTTDGRFGYQWR